ncbi:2Fe-2S iron-sulfur cluster-binding protein [Cohnella nanjingensis]|uniref:2Fe-2S iron-sulfur cluster binding domain-containing protein n=1 Tax=Cohnella nanjingensis TaxID=1387779 RepID=A0A7X0VHH6_9BACL|nr:2Fe-2S iron-sulfur cluster-binding protein [Cohnella nanjingensis]MBB6674155.1 2Fe-2S iron-sulfur cluster binding domain-containing protein [Cohnella nanjingensis]
MTERRLCRVTFLPDGRTADVRLGTSLLDAAKRAKAPVRTRCGGVAGCLMCKVKVDGAQSVGALTEPTPAERHKLGPLLAEGTRLSCQARVKADVTATIPEDPLKAAIRKKMAERADDELW